MRILLISYYFPPYNTVGAVRPGKLAKYLHRQGHTVHVISAQEPPFVQGLPLEIPQSQVHEARGWSVNAPIQWLLGGKEKVAREGYMRSGVQRGWLQQIGAWYKTFLHWPDAEIGWVGSAIAIGRQVLAQDDFDLIYVTSPSFSALRVGNKLALQSNTPWIAEFRDLWSDNHSYSHPAWRLYLDRLWEKKLLKSASALVTISSPFAETLKRFGKPVWEIRNGFDPEDLVSDFPPHETAPDILEIVYTGSVYPEHHDLDSFCAGLASFRAQGGKARVNVVGRNVAPLLEAAQLWKVDDWMNIQPTVERAQAISMQRSADVLLLFLWSDGNSGIYTTKLFEYAGAGRPILALGPHRCDVGSWIEDANIGSVVFNAQDVAASLLAWQESKKLNGRLETTPTPGQDFTRNTQFSKLEACITTLLTSSSEKHR
jgi:glycosyltransferase involved in cell wall biosynthesis